MARLFYTLEEAATKLTKTTDEVKAMAASGQLVEFRDGDRVLFQVEAIDSLATDGSNLDDLELKGGTGASSGDLPGLDSGSFAGLASSDVAPASPNAADGDIPEFSLSLEDSDPAPAAPAVPAVPELEPTAPLGSESVPPIDLSTSSSGGAIGMSESAAGGSAITGAHPPGDDDGHLSLPSSFSLVEPSAPAINLADSSLDDSLGASGTGSPAGETASLETVSSGSGLLDLTRNADDTSIGAALLDEVMNADDGSAAPAGDALADIGSGEIPSGGSSVLGVVGPGASAVTSTPGLVLVAAPAAYDGRWSGVGAGALMGAAAAVGLAATLASTTALGATPQLTDMISGDLWMWTGGIGGGILTFAIIGFFVGRATE